MNASGLPAEGRSVVGPFVCGNNQARLRGEGPEAPTLALNEGAVVCPELRSGMRRPMVSRESPDRSPAAQYSPEPRDESLERPTTHSHPRPKRVVVRRRKAHGRS